MLEEEEESVDQTNTSISYLTDLRSRLALRQRRSSLLGIKSGKLGQQQTFLCLVFEKNKNLVCFLETVSYGIHIIFLPTNAEECDLGLLPAGCCLPILSLRSHVLTSCKHVWLYRLTFLPSGPRWSMQHLCASSQLGPRRFCRLSPRFPPTLYSHDTCVKSFHVLWHHGYIIVSLIFFPTSLFWCLYIKS